MRRIEKNSKKLTTYRKVKALRSVFDKNTACQGQTQDNGIKKLPVMRVAREVGFVFFAKKKKKFILKTTHKK